MLLTHNQKTLDELEAYVANEQNCCVVNPCGSGKTSIMSEFIKRHNDKDIIVFTKQKNAEKYYCAKDDIFNRIQVKTYSKMIADYNKSNIMPYKADIYILDEAHYAGAQRWGEAFEYMVSIFNPILVGFTATPQRFEQQGTDETIITNMFNGNSAGNYSTKDLQKAGVFVEPEYVLSLYNFEDDIEEKLDKIDESDLSDNIKIKWQEYLQKALDDWHKHSSPEIVLQEKLPAYMYKKRCNRILVYTSSVADIPKYRKEIDKTVRNIFHKKVSSYRYTYLDDENTLKEFLSDDDNSYIKILYSVDKIMETIHIDDLNIVIMLRPSVSNRIITQQFGRINSIGNDKKSLIIDMVGNLSNLNTIKFLGEKASEKTDQENNEQKPHINLRYISSYGKIFEEIDKVFSKSVLYKYQDFQGSLSQIAKICNVSYSELKYLVHIELYDVEQAVQELYKKHKFNINSYIFDGYEPIPEFTLTEEQKHLAEENVPVVERFVKRRNINDEDIVQQLYIEMMYVVSKSETLRVNLRTYLLNRLNYQYMNFYRHKHLHNQLWNEQSLIENDIPLPDTTINTVIINDIKERIKICLDTLTNREKCVLRERFGLNDEKCLTLDEVARIHGVTRERIRQIEAKALRKLRHPSRSKKLSPINDTFDAYEEMQQVPNLF